MGARGQATLLVLLVLFLFTVNAVTFISMMHTQQAGGGAQYRRAAAFFLAEAALARAVWLLEHGNGPEAAGGATWRPADHREPYRVGSLVATLRIRIADEPTGTLSITGQGEVGGTARSVRLLARLASGTLRYPLFSLGAVWLEGETARTYLAPRRPAPAGRPCERPGGDLGSSGEVWFRDPRVRLNAPDGALLDLREGAVRDHELFGFPAPPHPGDPSIWDAVGGIALTAGGAVSVREDRRRVTEASALSSAVPGAYARGLKAVGPLDLPAVDLALYRDLAAQNGDNAVLHRAAGLRDRDGSVYTEAEMGRLLSRLNEPAAPVSALRGVVYLRGNLVLASGQRLTITDGALIVEGSVILQSRARLEVRRSEQAGRLPGVVTRDGVGTILIAPYARFAVDGLVYAGGTFDVRREGMVDIVGGLLAADPTIGYRNSGGTVVIRYDPVVMRTTGMRVVEGSRGVAVAPLSWQEGR